MLELPELLDIPDKLLPLITEWNRFSYFLIDGGRSSGKTQSIARTLLYLAEQSNTRIICGREFQNSIEESVYTVFADLIKQYDLDFEVLASKIDHRKTLSPIRFRGFREQGSVNIKGLEGAKVLWIDEAQSISKTTLDIIIPTVRKEKSKIIFSMNRHVEQDPVYQAFALRSDCLHIHINYNENKHCPQKMKDEAEICKAKSLDDFQNIWLGEPREKSADFLFGMSMLRDSIGLDMSRIGVSRCIIGVDVSRYGDCETVFTVLKSHGPIQWEQHYQETMKHDPGSKAGEIIVGRVLAMQKEFGAEAIVMDADGAGGYLTDFMPETKDFEVFSFNAVEGWKDDPDYDKYGDRRTAAYNRVKEWIEKGWLKILADQTLIDQLLTIRYHYTRDGQRSILYSKDDMRREDIPSPDRGDALMMACWFADQLMGPKFHDNGNYARMDRDVEMIGKPQYAGME